MTDITKHIEDMRTEIKHISLELVRLTTVTEQQLTDRRENTTKLNNLHTEFTHLKGGLSFLRAVVGFLSASIIAFCTWIVTSGVEQNQQITKLYSQVNLLENKVKELENDLTKEKPYAKIQ